MALKTYEGLFLLDPTSANQDWDGLKNKVVALLERRDGQVISAKKWGERRLSYEIKGRKRGTYLLIYFQMPADNIATLKRDIQLSEMVLRNMIVTHDRAIDQEDEKADSDKEKVSEETKAKTETKTETKTEAKTETKTEA